MTPPLRIVPADPKAGYLAHREELNRTVVQVLERGEYILGPEVRAFEEAFAHYLGISHAVGVGNGTDALHLALRAGGVKPGDAVATVSHTAVATVAAIEAAGATPVLVDIDPITFTMDPQSLNDAIVRANRVPGLGRLRAVVPVHLYGHPADMPAILEISRRHELLVVEDCAQAHGSSLHGRHVGTWSDLSVFSFYPTKNLGALGDGGAVVTPHREWAEQVRLLREYGWRDRYISAVPGFNSRLDEMQAAILRVKLRYLDTENEARRALARAYDVGLAGLPLRLPSELPGARHVYHQYVVPLAERDAVRAALRERGIGTIIHYPVPVHLQPAYRDRLPLMVDLSRTEAAAREVLSLPIYPELPAEGVGEVVRALRELGAQSPWREA